MAVNVMHAESELTQSSKPERAARRRVGWDIGISGRAVRWAVVLFCAAVWIVILVAVWRYLAH